MSQMSLFPNNSHFDRDSHQKDAPRHEPMPHKEAASGIDASSIYQDLIDLHGDMEAKFGRADDFVYRMADIVADMYEFVK